LSFSIYLCTWWLTCVWIPTLTFQIPLWCTIIKCMSLLKMNINKRARPTKWDFNCNNMLGLVVMKIIMVYVPYYTPKMFTIFHPSHVQLFLNQFNSLHYWIIDTKV
jgi:hypothetical protein